MVSAQRESNLHTSSSVCWDSKPALLPSADIQVPLTTTAEGLQKPAGIQHRMRFSLTAALFADSLVASSRHLMRSSEGGFAAPSSHVLLYPLLFCRRAIRAAFKNKERAAILTTHYMEEADAVCDRVAILVAGQLRYCSAGWAAGG